MKTVFTSLNLSHSPDEFIQRLLILTIVYSLQTVAYFSVSNKFKSENNVRIIRDHSICLINSTKMNPLVVVASIIILQANSSYTNLDEDLVLPTWPNYKTHVADTSETLKKTLIGDDSDGCMCQEVSNKLTVCFGRDSCREFIQHFKINTTLLRIQNTKIKTIRRGDFGQFSNLKSLQIEANYDLSKIQEGTFERMTNLTNMSICYNSNLKVLQEGTFMGLVNLKELFLIKNGFSQVSDVSVALSPNHLPHLFKLSLSENSFGSVQKGAFQPMLGSNLQELNLVLCQIEFFHSEALFPLKSLSVVRLGENRFNTSVISNLIEKSIELRVPLKSVNLYNVGFRISPPKSLLEAISKSNISQLSLAKNQFEIISDDTFPPMLRLELLDLREALVGNITENAFKRAPNLHTLLLSGNKLSSVPDGVLLENLTYLDLSSNSGNSFIQSYFSLGKNKFVKMKRLAYVNLSFNQINTLFEETFIGLERLKILGLGNATIFHIEDGAFKPLTNLIFLNLENNFFARRAPLSSKLFDGLWNLEVLLLGGCYLQNLSQTSFKNLVKLKHLGLQNNHLLTLKAETLTPLVNLRSVDLSKNFMAPWQSRLFAKNPTLKTILASHNKFSYLSTAMLEDFSNLSRLDVSSNPYTCDCLTFVALQEWVGKEGDKILTLVDANPGFCVYPDEAGDQTITKYFKSLQNSSTSCALWYKPNVILFHILASLTLVIIILGACAVVYIYRWTIRYWIFLARLNLGRLNKSERKMKFQSYTGYQYDAFVSYSNDDCNFVLTLVRMLENYEPYLKLCVYERDFQIGAVISESILESVSRSRKTLLIISDSYVRSQWCRWELQIAEHHRLFLYDRGGHHSDDSLIIIKLGQVSDLYMTPTLKYLMKTRVYLEWDLDPRKQKVFWEKLRKIISPKVNYDSSA